MNRSHHFTTILAAIATISLAPFLAASQRPQPIDSTRIVAPGTLALFRIVDDTTDLVSPIDVVTRPGDPKMYIIDLGGKARILDGAELLPNPFLDLTSIAHITLSTGLRGMAFHPNYKSNGFVYVWYDFLDAQGAIQLGIGRLQRSLLNSDQIDISTFVELLREPQFIQGHGSSSIKFGPDGMLYVALGDGGNRDDPNCNAQNHQLLTGSILRIDVDSAFPYAIPPDNPFLGDPSIRDECWHLGMRHPWRWSFDSLTGDLWIGEVGNDRFEEINWVPSGEGGRNFGWSVMEGNECFALSMCPPSALPCNDPGYTPPILTYPHSVGCSIIGGFVYRGQALPQEQGRYFYSDFCSSEVSSLRWDGSQVTEWMDRSVGLRSLNGGVLDRPVGFAEDNQGELLVIDFNDQEIYRFISDCFVESYCPQLENSTGQAATLTWDGYPTRTPGDLTFHGSKMPPGTIAHVFYSSNTESAPLANSTLCVSNTNSYFRLPTFQTNAAGRFHYSPDFGRLPLSTGLGQIQAGSVWYFQAWFRDSGAIVGSESSLSNALSLYFCQ